jgi:hypothetical protein
MFLRFLFTHQKNKRSIIRIFFGPFFFSLSYKFLLPLILFSSSLRFVFFLFLLRFRS